MNWKYIYVVSYTYNFSKTNVDGHEAEHKSDWSLFRVSPTAIRLYKFIRTWNINRCWRVAYVESFNSQQQFVLGIPASFRFSFSWSFLRNARFLIHNCFLLIFLHFFSLRKSTCVCSLYGVFWYFIKVNKKVNIIYQKHRFLNTWNQIKIHFITSVSKSMNENNIRLDEHQVNSIKNKWRIPLWAFIPIAGLVAACSFTWIYSISLNFIPA